MSISFALITTQVYAEAEKHFLNSFDTPPLLGKVATDAHEGYLVMEEETGSLGFNPCVARAEEISQLYRECCA